ncbi:glycogen debranching protein GlgX [Myceligenerans halotolerans]
MTATTVAAATPRRRVDSFPTDQISGFGVRCGRSLPFGATLVPGGVNFSIFSITATSMVLVLFRKGDNEPFAEIPFPEEYRIGGCWSMTVYDLPVEDLEYGYRADGPDAPGNRFTPSTVLCDPYARAYSGRETWGATRYDGSRPPYRSRLVFDDFDWDGDTPLRTPMRDLVIYEAHVRGLTAHPSSGVRHPGTFAGLIEKIPHLEALGVNCIELLPVFEFDEFENSRENSDGQRLLNYWGYSTVGFFAPKAGFAATGSHGMQVDEFKNLVRSLHRRGIEVILDVVFNHTAEGNENGPSMSFRGLDNAEYYILGEGGEYYNYSGTGNTFNCNNPVVREFILDSLRYWASECHVDGFRFDLASILGRGPDGAPLDNPPLLETLAGDPILRDCKLIAEAWDAGGLYQVGSFPAYGRWAEWNGRFRDTVRRFVKGDAGQAGNLASALIGSPEMYRQRGTEASINFVTCHDGFTLADMVSYNDKHNEANGEDNRDGADDNNSWNCGAEGITSDSEVLDLRSRQVRNALTLLLTSLGVPMLLAGDEFGRTQGGNNNAYCHDDPVSWVDWDLGEDHRTLQRFTAGLVALRRAHPCLTAEHPTGTDTAGFGYPDISWHGAGAWQPDWTEESRLVALMHSSRTQDGRPDFVYIAANSYWEDIDLELPRLPDGLMWRRAVDTSRPSPEDVCLDSPGIRLTTPDTYHLPARTTLVLVSDEQTPAL